MKQKTGKAKDVAHRAMILDQFTKQAVPFATAPPIRNEEALNRIVKMAEAGDTDVVLDVGCGPGLLVCAFARQVQHATGLDITPAMLDQARQEQKQRNISNVSWQKGDILSVPYQDQVFSIVVSRFTLHHLLEPVRAVREMRRVCKRGGRIVIADGCPDAAKAEALDQLERLRDPSHVRLLNEGEIVGLFEGAGLPKPRIQRYRMEGRLQYLLERSFPQPGAEEQIRDMFTESLKNDSLDLCAQRVGEDIVFGYPVAVFASHVL
jgi:ubiquinone/menaquinone biosynthesis C-methylase UbiE